MGEPGSARRAWVERFWITIFIGLGFLFAVLAPPLLGLPLTLAAAALGILDAYAFRRLLGWQWVAAAVIFGVMWVVFVVIALLSGQPRPFVD